MAVFETARGGILREGLAFDCCDVAVVTNIGDGDHLGTGDVNTPEELAKVKRCIVEGVSPEGYAVSQCQRSAGAWRWRPAAPATSSSSPSMRIIPW